MTKELVAYAGCSRYCDSAWLSYSPSHPSADRAFEEGAGDKGSSGGLLLDVGIV